MAQSLRVRDLVSADREATIAWILKRLGGLALEESARARALGRGSDSEANTYNLRGAIACLHEIERRANARQGRPVAEAEWQSQGSSRTGSSVG